MTHPKIIGISGRSSTGLSRPFFCDADDGHSYFVKRDNVSWDSLVTEYLISSLAVDYGLPVAPLTLLEIPEELTELADIKDRHEFLPGIAFGSTRIPFSDDVRESHLSLISDEKKIQCLCFDWWVRNSDRKLNMLGGDSNLLWDPIMGSLQVIDHDRCLDQGFDPEEFHREHAFRDSRELLKKATLKKLRTKFESAIYSLDKIWKTIPEEWLVNAVGESRISFTMHDVESILINPEFPADGILPV